MRPNRPRLLALAALALSLLALPRPSDALTLRVAFINAGTREQTGPEGWARRDGSLERELRKVGVTEVRFIGFPNGPDVNEAFAAGELDLALYGDTPALIGRAAGLRTRAVYQTTVGQNALLVTRPDGPRALAELAGKPVATSKGSYMHRYLLGLLDEAGLRGRVTIVHLLPRDAEAALTRGEIAAYAAPIGTGPLLVQRGFRVLDEATRHPHLLGTSVAVTTERFLAEHPEVLRAWDTARRAALADLRRKPEAYYAFAAEASGLPLAVAKASFPIDGYDDAPLPPRGAALLEGTKAFLVRHRFARNDFRIEDWTARIDPQAAPRR